MANLSSALAGLIKKSEPADKPKKPINLALPFKKKVKA
jgi:hypothetical protein